MTKKFLAFICLPLLCVSQGFAYNPFSDGAQVDLHIMVVDETGAAVSDAKIDVSFATDAAKSFLLSGTTNSDGMYLAKHKTIGSIWISVKKDGYYTTRFQPKINYSVNNIVLKTKEWTSKPLQINATLKKRRNPARLILKGGTFQELQYPATNVVMGLDLKKFDWCPPYGKGEYDDLQIKYDFWRSPTNWFQVYSHLDITMTNGFDGVYLAHTDDFSKMNRCYNADTNAVYIKALEYVYDRKKGTVVRDIEMPEDKYMVFRTRTKVDNKGELVSANYGLIFEKSGYGIKLNMRTAFNPIPNDTNLECEGGWR